MSKYKNSLQYFAWSILGFELLIIFLYSYFVRIDYTTVYPLKSYYPWYQDVNVMMLIGFGFLMTFIRSYSWGAVGLTFLINAIVVQAYVIFNGLWKKAFHGDMSHISSTIDINAKSLIFCSYAVASVLITFGALIGRVTPSQLMFIAIFEIFFYSLNEQIVYASLKVVDAGGSTVIHTFGAYFGLAVSYVLGKKFPVGAKTPVSSYESNIFAMIGSIFLWLFWPSFNSAMLASTSQNDAVIRFTTIVNTIVALTGSCLASFSLSQLLRSKFDMEDVLNATLAGGVMIGAPSSIMLNPVGALAIGIFAGLLSTTGFSKITSRLNPYIYDVCGIHNLHALPGLLGGLISAAIFGFYVQVTTPSVKLNPDSDYDYSKQAGMQVAGTFCSMGIAIASGLLTGFVMNFFSNIEAGDHFEDKSFWEIPEVKEHEKKVSKETEGIMIEPGKNESMEIMIH